MLDINLPNIVTVGIISVVTYALVRAAAKAAGVEIPFVTA